MAITVAMRTQVAQLYVSLFGRAPDGEGLGFWVGQLDAGQTLAQVAQSMYSVTAARTYYPAYATNEEIVATFYQNVLGRAVGTDTEGQAFWVAKMNAAGATKGSVITEILNTVANYTGTDAAGVASKALFNNKVSVAQYYGEQNGSIAGATNALSGVTSDVATVATAKAAAAASTSTAAATGSSFTLTTGVDNFTGTAGNDTFVGDWGSTTVQASDQVNGGAGIDTLKVYGALGTLPLSLTSVEVVDLVNPGTTSITDTAVGLNASVKTLKIEQVPAVASSITTTSLSGVTLDLATALGAGASAVTWAGNATDTAQTLTLSGYQGATGATAAALSTTGAAVTTMNVNSGTAKNVVSTLTLPATATTVNIVADTALSASTSLAATAAKTVNISGAGAVTIAGSDFAATVAVNASTATGAVAYTAEAAGSTLTFTGGAGNDSVTFAAGTLTTADVLVGGAGTDTLVINDTALTTVANLAAVNAVTGFENIKLATTAATLDVSLLAAAYTGIQVGTGNLSETFTNAASTNAFTIVNAGNTGTVSIANKVGELSTSVTLDAGTATSAQTLANLTISGPSTINLVSTGTGTGGANTITALANPDNSVINVSGAKALTITGAIAGTAVGSKVDASTLTGALTVVGSGQNDILIGGAGNDVINGGAGKDTITGGAGNDTITIADAGQADVITLGAGSDIVAISGTATTMFARSSGTTDIVSITDFVAGTDKISLQDTSTAFTSITLATGQTIATAADLTAVFGGITAIAASADNGALSGAVITVSAGAAAGTYLYVNDTTAGVSNSADLLVKLTGLTGTLTAADFTFA